ncbi:MAG: urease accessory UreF family protein, partial [Verrucomicrobiota bacterium]
RFSLPVRMRIRWGLEEWAKQCSFRSGEDLTRFFNEHVGPALTRLELPYLRFVREALTKDEWEALLELDMEIDAWKWASEIREASMAQGRGRLRLLKKLWPDAVSIARYAEAFGRQEACGHHLVVSALQFELLEVPEQASLMAYGYQSLANYVSASIKLLRISPEAAQAALHAGLDQLEGWVKASNSVERNQAGWFAPAFDISTARHSTAFSRLFIS